MSSIHVLELGPIELQSGETLADAKLVYAVFGKLNSSRDNVIVMPTYYTGTHASCAPLIGRGLALDPDRYFIVIPNMFGNGVSSSPSRPRTDTPFPVVSIWDNVMQQARLVFDVLGVQEIALVTGWSLGGIQAYQWAALFPGQVRRLLPFCAAARTSAYNLVFLEGLKSILAETSENGVRAFARVYAGWAYSYEFFRDRLFEALGYGSIEQLLQSWENEHLELDARDLLAMLETWRIADISANSRFGGNFAEALAAIRADTILLPCSTDRYFPSAENFYEARWIPRCEVVTLESSFGHCALSPGRVPGAGEFLNHHLARLLNR